MNHAVVTTDAAPLSVTTDLPMPARPNTMIQHAIGSPCFPKVECGVGRWGAEGKVQSCWEGGLAVRRPSPSCREPISTFDNYLDMAVTISSVGNADSV